MQFPFEQKINKIYNKYHNIYIYLPQTTFKKMHDKVNEITHKRFSSIIYNYLTTKMCYANIKTNKTDKLFHKLSLYKCNRLVIISRSLFI